MNELNGLAEKFHELFSGAENAHGICELAEGKRIAAKTVRSVATIEIWDEHLEGVRNVGLIPIREDGLCSWGAIDVDAPQVDVDLAELAAQIDRTNLPLIACRSKSGGAHLYAFAAPISASDMQDHLKYCAKRLGHPHAEVFPKQTKVNIARGDVGSWILMPYFNARYTKRYAVDPQGKRLSAKQFLEAAVSLQGSI